jgi:hypothetical protein
LSGSHILYLGALSRYSLDNKATLELEPRTWIVFVLCVLQGIDAGILIQTALYTGNMAAKTKFSIPFVLMFLTLGVMLGFNPDFSHLNGNGIGLPLGIFGAIFVVLGQKTVFGDRKRGEFALRMSVALLCGRDPFRGIFGVWPAHVGLQLYCILI